MVDVANIAPAILLHVSIVIVNVLALRPQPHRAASMAVKLQNNNSLAKGLFFLVQLHPDTTKYDVLIIF